MKKGISLIALVITIIVLIILTSTVLIVFRENGIVDRAKEATFKSDFSNVLDSFTIQKSNIKLEALTNSSIQDPDIYVQDNIKENIAEVEGYIPTIRQLENKEIKGKEYLDLIQIYQGKIYQLDNISDEQIEQWLNDVGIPKLNDSDNQEEIITIVDNNNEWVIEQINGTDTYKLTQCNLENQTDITIPHIIKRTVNGEEIEYKITQLDFYYNGVKANFRGNLIISSGIETISSWCFCNLSGLTSVKIPDSVTKIGNAAFQSCSSLTTIILPNNLEEIPDNMFWSCNSLNGKLAIPDSVKKIGKRSFYNSGLNEIKIGENVKIIDEFAFCQCINLSSIDIPDSVEEIRNSAFNYCNNLSTVTIPKNVNLVSSSAFYDCNILKEILVNNENKNYCSIDGVLFNKSVTNLVTYPKGRRATNNEYVIPNTVTTISGAAFYNTYLRNITIPSTVTSIGSSTFRGSLLNEVSLPNITSIESYTFTDCILKNIEIPNTVTKIGISAFNNCSMLKSITVPSSVTSIEDSTFMNCNNVTSIKVGNDTLRQRFIDFGFSSDIISIDTTIN